MNSVRLSVLWFCLTIGLFITASIVYHKKLAYKAFVHCKFFSISAVTTLCLLTLAKEMRLLNLISILAVTSLGSNVMPPVQVAQRLADSMITITNLMFVLFAHPFL